MPIRSLPRFVLPALMLVATFGVFACGDDDDDRPPVKVLECSGTCSCDAQTRTCSCSGGTDCVLAGEGNVTFSCDGNASCGLSCTNDCNIICPGTTGCVADSGARARFECQGNASCEFTCKADCVVQCAGAAQCLVTCTDPETCDLTDCRGSTDCGGGVFACGRSCP
jgi:hypothetical protein